MWLVQECDLWTQCGDCPVTRGWLVSSAFTLSPQQAVNSFSILEGKKVLVVFVVLLMEFVKPHPELSILPVVCVCRLAVCN